MSIDRGKGVLALALVVPWFEKVCESHGLMSTDLSLMVAR